MPHSNAIQALLERQRAYFTAGHTLPISSRLQALTRLEEAILRREEDLYRALQADLGKSPTESFLCEVGLTLSELRYVRRHLKSWSRGRRVPPSPAQFPGRCRIQPEPYGVVLILSPWNYPVLLTLEPLIGALAAGNCCVVKPSAYSPPHLRRPGRPVGGGLPRPPAPRPWCRGPAGEPESAGAALRLYLLHRQPVGGPGGDGQGRPPPDPGDPGAGG